MTAPTRTLKELFLTALDVAPADRAAWLERECAADAGLREHLSLMLAAHDAPQSLLDRPGAAVALSGPLQSGDAGPTIHQPMAEGPGTVVGPYKLRQLIGEGGMGTVYLAEQTEPVKRLVALKVIKPGMDSKQVIARFEAERQALALMEHPNIARVLDAGTTSAGRPYFVMDLVKGVPFTKYCDEHRLTPRQRLELFIPVCQAVQHAHQKGIIHRDLKPSNVLVALYDGKPVPKVIDFGVAKAAGQSLTDKTLITGFGTLVGTLEYMSPEQAEINQLDIDTRSDIYSLGVLLYELLTGSTPFSQQNLQKAGMLEMLRVIREDEPSKPSTKLSSSEALPSLSANRGTEPAKLTRLVRGELDWIVMKALEKDRSRRYETANGFAADIQRYLSDEQVLACPPSAGYRFRKFARRNKGPVLAVSVVLATLLAGIVGTSWGMLEARDRAEGERSAKQQAERERDAKERALRKEERERKYAQAIADFIKFDFLAMTSVEGQERFGGAVMLDKDSTLRQLLDRAAAKLNERLDLDPRIEAELRGMIGLNYRALGESELAIPFLERCVTLQKEFLGPDDDATLDHQNTLAVALGDTGQLERTTGRIHEETWKLRKAKHGPSHYDTLLSMGNLADSYYFAERLDLSLEIGQEAVKLMTTHLGAEDPLTILHTDKLAENLRRMGRLEAAVSLAQKNLKLAQTVTRVGYAAPILCTNTLARCYGDQGKWDLALPLFEESLQISREKVGNDHPLTLNVMSDLAQALVTVGKLAEAIDLYEQARKIHENHRGADHDETLRATSNLAVAYRHADRNAEAIPLLEQVMQAQERKLGAGHPDLQATQNSLAVAYGLAGRHTDAIKILEPLGQALVRKFSVDHRDTQLVLRNLAVEHLHSGNRTEAIRLLEQVKASREKTHDSDHLETLIITVDLGWAYHQAGRTLDAIRLLEHVNPLIASKLGNEHSETLTARNHLAAAYIEAGKHPEAIRLLEQIREIQERTREPGDFQRLQAIARLADAYQAASRLPEAIRLYEQIKTDCETKHGANHRETISCLNNLGTAYWLAKQLDRSVPIFEEVLKRLEANDRRDDYDSIMARINLGVNYRDAGRLDEALPLLEEGYPLSKAHASLVWVGEALVAAYIKAGKSKEAVELLAEDVASIRLRMAEGSLPLATQLMLSASHYLNLNQSAEAESLMRECLAIREKSAPDAWTTFNTQSMLGEALMQQKKYADAEPLLLKGFQGMNERATMMPAEFRFRLSNALERLVRLYEAMEKMEEAEKWRKELEAQKTSAAKTMKPEDK